MSEVDNLAQAFDKSNRMRTAEVTMIGDRNVIVQVITILSYLRNAIQSGQPHDIKVEINKNVLNGDFEFLVNNSKTADLIAKEKCEIN